MYFLTMMKKLPKATISVGWTTKLNRHPQNHGYVFAQLKAMALALIYKEIKQPVTFAVRAAFVANSKDDLLELVNSKLRKDSLVVWKPKSDLVDKKKLMMALDAVAHERVMLDMTTRSFVSS